MAKRQVRAEKWVVNQATHLGGIRRGVRPGVVIEHDLKAGKIIIEGREYDNDMDLEIMKNHGWVERYSAEAVKKQIDGRKAGSQKRATAPKKEQHPDLPIVQSDADAHDIIDIRHTKKAKAGVVEVSKDMEIIRGDETPEERVARLQDTKADMPVVQDDSLGEDVAGIALNVGQPKDKVAAKPKTTKKAARRKTPKKAKRARGTKPSVDVSKL